MKKVRVRYLMKKLQTENDEIFKKNIDLDLFHLCSADFEIIFFKEKWKKDLKNLLENFRE